MKIPDNIKGIMQKLLDNNYDAYIIGGAIRDYFLGIEPHDWDIFTNATGDQILKIFPGGKVLGGEERQEKILTVIEEGNEVSQYRSNGDRTKTGNSLYTHLSTCDFTVNAIAMDINGKIYDPYTGIYDIRDKVLRFVGNGKDRIKEDPLRILRGIRFWSTFPRFADIGMVLENLDLLDTLPIERIREEFLKIIKHPQGIENLWNKGIIYKIIPELKKVLIMEGGDHHDETVDNHMQNSFREACKITDNVILRLAIFLHDIGKGYTKTESNTHEVVLDKNGCPYLERIDHETHFYQHEKVGAKITEEIMERLKFSKEEIKYVTTLIKLHMFGYNEKITDKTYVKFFDKLEQNNISILDYIMLIYCDHQGNLAKPRIKFGDFLKSNYLYQNYLRLKSDKKPFNVNDLEVDGRDIINVGYKPGKIIGEIKNKLFDLVYDDKLINRRDILLEQLNKIKEEE